MKTQETLHLNLKHEWFVMIKTGVKKEEYRELTPYWKTRLVNVRKRGIKTITFSNGYAKDRRQFVIELDYITIATGVKAWGAEPGKMYYNIHLGKVLPNKVAPKQRSRNQ